MIWREGEFDVMANNQLNALKISKKYWARGNRKTLKRPKMMTKISFRNLTLKIHGEYLICRRDFVYQKT